MTSSLKIGAISGLVAGFVASIVFSILAEIAASMGLWKPSLILIIPNSAGVNIILGILFGIVLGVIFSKTYYLIPGKNVLKGLVYGLILVVILTVRGDTFWVAYSLYLWVAGDLLSWPLTWVVYGLVLGFLYKLLCGRYRPTEEEPKIITYEMKSGLLPGAIAGICGGMAASIVAILGPAMGLWTMGVRVPLTFDFWMGQAGTHILLNMIWGTVFGSIFPKVYNLVPSRGVKKGLCYGLIIFLITAFQGGAYWVSSATFHNVLWIATFAAGACFAVGGAQAITYGLVLGALYKK